MADPTYEQLKTPMSRDEVLTTQLEVLKSPEFKLPVASWGAFDEPYATLAADAEVLADASVKIAGIAKAGVTEDCDGDVLTVHAADVFDEQRELGVATLGSVTLTETGGSSHSWAAGELLFVSRLDSSITYVNTSSVSLSALSTSSPIPLTAQEIGSAYNIQGSDLQLATAVPGVTLVVAPRTGWITQSGTDDESDEKLRLRCSLKWDTLATTGPENAYKKWALDASSSVNRAKVTEDPAAVYPSPAVTVTIAGPTGAVGSGVVTTVDTYVQTRRPLGILVLVQSASVTSFDLKGSVTVRASKRAAAEIAINTLLDDWFAGNTITVNGESIDGLQIGDRVRIAQVIEIVMSVSGVVSFTPKKADGTTIYVPETDDLVLGADAVAGLVRSLSYVEVT